MQISVNRQEEGRLGEAEEGEELSLSLPVVLDS